MLTSILKYSVLILVFIVNYIIYDFTKELENKKCECSKSWKRDLIKYYSLFTIVITIFILLLGIFGKINLLNDIKFILIFKELYIIIGCVNIYALFTYTQELLQSKCSCDPLKYQKFLYHYSRIIFICYVFILTISLCLNVHYKKLNIEKLDLIT